MYQKDTLSFHRSKEGFLYSHSDTLLQPEEASSKELSHLG